MAKLRCPEPTCRSTRIETDYSAGNVTCQDCGTILDQGLLVSEVTFAESAGGRVHVQGTFVSHHATGISGFRGTAQSSENVKEEGRKRIQLVCAQMGIGAAIIRGAQRLYSLAVDNKFNRGRRTDFVVASCIYLQSRFEGGASMLIDFSERLSINVYELGATYLKLRSTLNLDLILPEIDPSVYNIRFANRLELGPHASVVARDASRLVRRFSADWMTSGRRPAGICGACLVIAARMSNFLRTPEEVAQVVKVAPQTIKKRLREFAQTSAATKTVEEWRNMTDEDLSRAEVKELPPIMKRRIAAEEKKRREEELNNEREEGARDDDDEEEEDGEGGGEERQKSVNADQAMQQAAADSLLLLDGDEEAEPEEEEEEEPDLAPLEKEDYAGDVQAAGTTQEEMAERRRERRAYLRSIRAIADGEEILEVLAETQGEGESEGEDDDETARRKQDDDVGAEGDEDELREIEGGEDEQGGDGTGKVNGTESKVRRKVVLPDWDDHEAVMKWLEEHYFNDQYALYGDDPAGLRQRVVKWLGGRDPQSVVNDMMAVDAARARREKDSRAPAETVFDDINDDELDAYWVMDEDEREARARMWLSTNGRWLEEDKERQEKKEALNRAKGIDPATAHRLASAGGLGGGRGKRRRGPGGAGGKGGGGGGKFAKVGPYKSASDAIEGFAAQNKISTRLDMAKLRQLGIDPLSLGGRSGSSGNGLGASRYASGLQRMDETDEDESYGDEKYDETGDD